MSGNSWTTPSGMESRCRAIWTTHHSTDRTRIGHSVYSLPIGEPLSGHMDHPPLHRPYAYWSFCIFSTYRQEGLPEDPYCHLPQAQPNAQYSQILNGSVQCLHLGSSVIMSLCPPGLRLAICFFKKTHLSNSVRL